VFTVNDQQRISLPVLALVLANLVPVFGALYLGWDVGSIVVLYWTENLIVGAYTVLKMFVTAGFGAVFLILFFCLHYGGFCAIHGLFVLELTEFAGEQPMASPAESWPGPLALIQMFLNLGRQVINTAPEEFLWACLALLLSHGISFVLLFIGQKEYLHTTKRKLMNAPYKRIVVLHIAVIAGGFLVAALDSPIGLLIALVALKTGMDIMLHNQSHKAAGKIDNDIIPEQKAQGEQQWK
jgi:hypothetical protein